MDGESDAFEDVIPVRVLVSPETVAAYGEAKPRREGDARDSGGRRARLRRPAPRARRRRRWSASAKARAISSSIRTAARSSARRRALGLDARSATSATRSSCRASMRPTRRSASQTTLNELYKFQCADGGFAFWPGECWTESPYLTSYVSHVLQRAQKLKYDVDDEGARARVQLSRRSSLQTARRRTKAGGRRTRRGRRSRSKCSSRAAATRTATSTGSTATPTACRCSASRISPTR